MSRFEKGILICAFIVFCIPLFITSSNDFTQDLGRHLLLGKMITQTGEIPKINLFSFTYPSYPFINHHWLSEVIFYVSSSLFGLPSLIFLKSALIVISLLIVLSIRGTVFAYAVAFFCTFLLLDRDYIRPELFSYLLFSISLVILFHVQKKRQLPFFLPVIYMLWINVHISFIFGLVILCFIFLSMQKSKQNIFLVSASIVALLINPNGIQGVFFPFTIFQNYGYSIAENQNMFFMMQVTNNIVFILFFIMLPVLIALCISLLLQKKCIGAGILFLFSVFPLIQIRHLPFFVFSAIAIIPQISVSFPKQLTLNIKKGMVIYGFVFIFLFTSMVFGTNLIYEIFDIRKTVGASFELTDTNLLQFLREKKITRFFNNFDIGSFLIYSLYPHNKVFVDGRPEAYPAAFFQSEYIPLQEKKEIQNRVFSQYHIDTVILSHTDQTPWASTFLERLSTDRQWKLIYADHTFVVFRLAKESKDIRSDESFFNTIDNDTNFFHKIQYARLLVYLENVEKAQVLMRQAAADRPHSCLIQKYRQNQSKQTPSLWCSFQSIKMF